LNRCGERQWFVGDIGKRIINNVSVLEVDVDVDVDVVKCTDFMERVTVVMPLWKTGYAALC